MLDIEKLNNELYKAVYVLRSEEEYRRIWNQIKSNPNILKEAIQVKRNKYNTNDTVKGLTICDRMLACYESVDEDAYQELIHTIYTNTDIARLVVDGYSNGGFSFLLMSLWNYNLKLTEEQKTFAVDEAMNKIGTTRFKQGEEALSKKLDDMGISDDITTFINIGDCINPIGQKSAVEYMNFMFTTSSNKQAHGRGSFDIRYHILRNPNWTLEEKQKLIMDFWSDDEVYDETLEQWEWSIINDYLVSSNSPVLHLEKNFLYEYSYEELLDFYKDKTTADEVWNEIQFCRQMHKLRPQQWELDFFPKKKSLS